MQFSICGRVQVTEKVDIFSNSCYLCCSKYVARSTKESEDWITDDD
jgi:hypothetical protein